MRGRMFGESSIVYDPAWNSGLSRRIFRNVRVTNDEAWNSCLRGGSSATSA